MSRALRLSEKWFRRGLWGVAVVFAGFLISLGSAVVSDLPKVESAPALDDFLDRPAAQALRAQVTQAQRQQREAQAALEQAQLALRVAQADTQNARESFSAWISTRRATERAEQDPQVLERTQALEALRRTEREAQGRVERQEQAALDARQAQAAAEQSLRELEDAARQTLQARQRVLELRVFLYRLAFTLPLLAAAFWLFKRRRQSTWWPFVWGFILFALFTFFVELVPYLPNWGGYVHSLVGVVVTALVGRQAIVGLNRYLARQKEVEQLPDTQRREALRYDLALARLAKGVCPGCERPVDLRDPAIDFCPHCGIGLHDRCGHCQTRKGAFAPFCHACGTPAGGSVQTV